MKSLFASIVMVGGVSAIDWGRICTDVNLRGDCVTYQSSDNQCGQFSVTPFGQKKKKSVSSC